MSLLAWPASGWPATNATLGGRLASAKKKVGELPKLNGLASLAAIAAIVGVPVLAALFPRSAAKIVMPLLAITSVGVYLTVPDTERVSLVMALVIMAAIVTFAATVTLHQLAVSGVAFVIMGAAIMDSGGREASIVRAAGCFGVVIAAPVAGWLNELRTNGVDERRTLPVIMIGLHCLLVGWSSRVLIRETSILFVVAADAAAFAVALIVLVLAARPVAVEA